MKYECNKCGHAKKSPQWDVDIWCNKPGCTGVYAPKNKKETSGFVGPCVQFAHFYEEAGDHIENIIGEATGEVKLALQCGNVRRHNASSVRRYCITITDDMEKSDFECPDCGSIPWE